MPYPGNEKTPVRKKLDDSNSIHNHHDDIAGDSFRRDDDLHFSIVPMKGNYGNSARVQMDMNLKYPNKSVVQGGQLKHSSERVMLSGQRFSSNESTMSDKEEQKITSPSVSHLIKGFESKTDSHHAVENSSFLTPNYGSYEENLEFDTTEKHKRNSSRRKLSLRKKGKSGSGNNATVFQKLGIAPFMGSENRNFKRSLAHFDVQSVLFDLECASVLKAEYADGGNRARNISTGASAASMKTLRKKAEPGDMAQAENVQRQSLVDEGDGMCNDLVENCPYFRNEIGNMRDSDRDTKERLLSKFNGSFSARVWTSMKKNRTPSLELLHTTDNDIDTFLSCSAEINDLDQKKSIVLLESVEEESVIALWDRPKTLCEKRVFEFEHIDLGALYYKNYFVRKDHQNYLGIDEKYGPICISIIRENIEKMAVLGHTKELAKCGITKFQYRIILRTTDLRTFRGTVLEDSIPSTTRHGTSRPLPARDILEYCFPELQISSLKMSVTGPKVPEHLQKLDEQQLSLQYKVGLLYCKAGQKSEEDMYNNEHHGPAFEEFMEMIGEKVFLKGFEGYRAQLDNKNDSTGIYSLYTKFQNREIMFHVSTLLPWTPHNKQQLLRKRHIGNDIVTVIFQEPGAEPFSPRNIRSHFQHVFIIVRVENSSTNNITYRVAVSRSQDVPDFGPPVPPDSSFRNNKAFRDFLLCKVINAENAAHKSHKFTAMAQRTRYEYLKDLATNFVVTQGLESAVPKFSKFNPMSLSVKKREKIHPPCSPEVWCQAGLVWSVKVDVENLVDSCHSFMVISTQVIALIDKVNKEVVAAIPCKSVIGWRNSGYSMRLYYNNGKGLNLTLLEDDGNEIIFIVNRLKAVTPGCQTQDMSLRRSMSGQLGFHVFYEGLVAEVEPYGMAWQAGLRKGSRLLEINNRLVGSMSHDRMIQALRKPGSTRVVVLPPLPDGQPRNYKSTRNLRRYSSMTSVYSERLPESSDTSSSTSSSEKIPPESVSTIRVGGQEMPLIKAIVKQTAPASKQHSIRNHAVRPYGFVLDSDQSLELTEASSHDHLFLSFGAAEFKEGDKDFSTGETSSSQIPRGKKKVLESVTPRVEDTGRQATPLGIDMELTEIEKTLTDTRKSIDAKFYRTLMQKSDSISDQSNGRVHSIKARSIEDGGRQDLPTQTSPINDCCICPQEASPLSSYKRALSSGGQDRNIVGADLGQLWHTSNESRKALTASQNRMCSPPPYEEAISSLERHRGMISASYGKDKATVSHMVKDPGFPKNQTKLLTTHFTDTKMEEKPRFLTRKFSPERQKVRSQVKSENLEDLGNRFPRDVSPKHELRAPPYEYIGNRNKLMVARSESNIPSSCEQYSILSDSHELHNANIVHSRVRDVDDIIKEKVHVRSESADQLLGAVKVLQTPRRSSSVDHNPKSVHLKDMHKESASTTSRKAILQSLPYSNQVGRSSMSQDNIAALQDTDLKFNSYFPPNREGSSTAMHFMNRSQELDNLNDTFAKIDEAFGFTSYICEQLHHHERNEKHRSRSKYLQSSEPSNELFRTVIEGKRDSALHLVASTLGGADEKSLHDSLDIIRTQSADSVEKKKSEAEESLEAAITEFHSTLSHLPEKQSIEAVDHTEEQTSTQSDTPFSSLKSPPSKTKFIVQSTELKPSEILTGKVRNDVSDISRGNLQNTQKKISCPDENESVFIRNIRRQDLNVLSRNYKGNGSRVQELVGKFSQKFERKNSLDSSVSRKALDRVRSRSEVRISVATPSSFVRKNSNLSGFKPIESSNIVSRYQHGENGSGMFRQTNEKQAPETPMRKRISVTVRPKIDMNSVSHCHIASNSSSFDDHRDKEMKTPPKNCTSIQKTIINRSVVDVPLSIRGLDLSPQRTEDLRTSSKEDLRLMLSVLSDELIKEKSQNERLMEELLLARAEKDQLMEQSKRSAAQLRKFTSWFYDSVPFRHKTTE